MSVQNEMRRVKLTNLRHQAKGLRSEIEGLARTICLNLDTSLHAVEDLPVPETMSQMDDLTLKWAELQIVLSATARLEEELR